MDNSNIKHPTLATVIQDAIKRGQLELHTSFPARIKSYDCNTQKASVIPLIKKKYLVPDKWVDLPVINGVPVHWPIADGGKSYIHLPLKAGDLGMCIVAERSIDKYLSSDGNNSIIPDSSRHHDISDSWFIPGVLPFTFILDDITSNNLIIKNDNLKIEIFPDGKIEINNSANELLSVLSDLIQHLIDAKVLTALGAQPFIASTIALLTQDKTKIDSFKS